MCTRVHMGGMLARVSIKDIAQAAGVSHPTVSRALRGDPRISAETADRVAALAREMGYTPSAAARSMVTRRTNTVGVVVTSIADPFVSDVVDGIEAEVAQHDYALILALSRSEPERELSVVRLLSEHRVDGIIVAASRVGALYDEALASLQVPLVLLNNQAEAAGAHSVEVDDVRGAHVAVAHLLSLGHHRIAFIGCPDRPRSNERRYPGYGDALHKHGLDLDESLVVAGTGSGGDLERGEMAMGLLLDLSHPPSAAFCYNDITAIGAMRQALRRGMTVPGHVSIVGFDDVREASLVTPALTTISQPRYRMGRQAAAMLLALLGGAAAPDTVIVPQLVIRESAAEPGGEAPLRAAPSEEQGGPM